MWAVGGLSHLGDLMFHKKTLHKTWWMCGFIVMMKPPVTGCPQLQPSESAEYFPWRNVQVSHKIWCKFIALFIQSFWMWWPRYTCPLNGIYCPHWLVQWSCHCSRMRIPVCSPLLPGYISVAQTVLINNGWTFSRQTLYMEVNPRHHVILLMN